MVSRSFTPIEEDRRTLAAQVQERIREAILKQVLKPGDRIDQNKLAAELKVSMAPVREALKGLEAEGLVMIQPRRGAFVVEVSISDMDNLYFTRRLIEGEAISLAVSKLTENDFATLQKMNETMRQATADGDVNTYIALNRQFHLHIYGSVDNQYLVQVIQLLWERSELYRYRYMFMTRDYERIHQEHDGILEACRLRDPALAKERAQNHIYLTQRALDGSLTGDSDGSRPDR
ncbi:MAG TPA: GntR family transcriptional regulator [Phototrophicaceae bacterium]|nr:GntR family transcriptional regulator [Phototrophicaceae bacterium]